MILPLIVFLFSICCLLLFAHLLLKTEEGNPTFINFAMSLMFFVCLMLSIGGVALSVFAFIVNAHHYF
jgi:hypothetical protein